MPSDPERPTRGTLRIGDWMVDPVADQISRDGTTQRLEARSMRLLLCLADRAGEVVSIDELLNEAWAGVIVTPDSVYQAVTSLRRLLGDDPKQPSYIATVPRRGYRLIATVQTSSTKPAAPAPVSAAAKPEPIKLPRQGRGALLAPRWRSASCCCCAVRSRPIGCCATTRPLRLPPAPSPCCPSSTSPTR